VAATTVVAEKTRPRYNASWVLPLMLTAVCAIAGMWAISTGPAAAGWLSALVISGFFGVPFVLVVLRVFGFEDTES
jgi:hypothetical protein